MSPVTVVGSGASGVHFARTLLAKGHAVRLLDVGGSGPDPVAPGAGLEELKERLPDPVGYFLGDRFESLTLPEQEGEYYGFPAHRRYIFGVPGEAPVRTEGFEPLFSTARGGLAEAWTAGVYPFNDDDLADFPFGYESLAPHYAEVSRRIGINGRDDDLAPFMPVAGPLQEPLRLDDHSAMLLRRYGDRRERLRAAGCHLGLSRIATLTRPLDGREPCTYLGRCMWGCPRRSLYTPRITLEECRRHDAFEYLDGVRVTRFLYDGDRRITGVAVSTERRDVPDVLPVDLLALAAGTLSTTRIVLASVLEGEGARPELAGLMDNRQVLVPFLTPRRIGRDYEPESYQYHQLCVGLEGDRPEEYVHGQITALTTAQVHPIIQSVPADFRTATYLFRGVRSALGLVNVNFHDRRRAECSVSLEPSRDGGEPTLVLRYASPPDEETRVGAALGRLRRALRSLGAWVVPGTHVRPMGSSVHYAGTLPMSEEPRPWSVSPDGRSHDFRNLLVVDGSTFPFLPAKNITYTLMANATRIAETVR